MLQIRREQIAGFREPRLKEFEDRVVAHLARCFPTQCEVLGEPEVRGTIRYGIERAAAYGMVAERDVCKYIDLMIVYGRNFDRDPALPWVRAILNDQTAEDPSVTVDRLYEEAKKNSGHRV
jgi:hypothetical protein